MSTLKELLVKPYIEVAFDEGDVLRIPAGYSDCQRFVEGWPELQKRLEAEAGETDPKVILSEAKGLFELCCGKAGDKVMRKCLDYLREGTDATDEDVVLGLPPVLEYIAQLWLAQANRMAGQHKRHVESYLRDADSDAI